MEDVNRHYSNRKSARDFALTDDKRLVLVVTRFQKGSVAGLTKGKINPDESIKDGAYREFQVETKINVGTKLDKNMLIDCGVTFFIETKIPQNIIRESEREYKGVEEIKNENSEVDGANTYKALEIREIILLK